MRLVLARVLAVACGHVSRRKNWRLDDKWGAAVPPGEKTASSSLGRTGQGRGKDNGQLAEMGAACQNGAIFTEATQCHRRSHVLLTRVYFFGAE